MRQKSIKRNMVMSAILTASNFIFPLITFSYVARVLKPAGTGRVAFVSSILQYFSYIAVLGIPAYGVREVARVRDNKEKMSNLVQELFVLNLLSTIVSYALLVLVVSMVPRFYSEKTLFIVMSSSIFLNTIGLEWVYQALEEYSYITIRSIVFKVISVILTFLLIKTERDVIFYGFLHIFTGSASYIMNFVHIRKYIKYIKKKRYNFRKHIKPIFTLFAASIIITIYANFDITMIGFISNEREVGLYNVGLKIKQIVLSLSTAVTAVLIPRMAYYLKDNNKDQAGNLIEKSLRLSLDLAIPVALFVFLYAKECISFLCGDEYIAAVNTLRILICCIVPLILSNLFGNQILIPSGKEKRYSQSVFVGLWINLVLNCILIPALGAFGAALSTLITECWNVFWMSGGVKDYRNMCLRKINYLDYFIPLMTASALSIVASNFFPEMELVHLVVSAIAFFGTYYFFLVICKEPILMTQLSLIKSRLKKVSQ